MKLPRSALLLLLTAVTAIFPGLARAERADGDLWKVSRDQGVYVEGILGETIFENRSDEAVVLDWGGQPCPDAHAYRLEQWVDGEWKARGRPNPNVSCVASVPMPIRVEPGQALVQDLLTQLADPVPGVLRVTYLVRTGCADGSFPLCERDARISTRPFFVIEGDFERALLHRARRYGTIDVIFGLGFPANPTPEEAEEAQLAVGEMIDDLAEFDVEILPGTSVGGLSVRATPEVLQFLFDDPRPVNLRQRARTRQVEELPLDRHR